MNACHYPRLGQEPAHPASIFSWHCRFLEQRIRNQPAQRAVVRTPIVEWHRRNHRSLRAARDGDSGAGQEAASELDTVSGMKRTYKDISYTLTYSRRKTASIYIERDGQVSVLVPDALSDSEIEQLLENKRKWIYQHQAEWQALHTARVQRAYVSGEGFLYLGRSYRLKVVPEQSETLMLKDGYFCLRANNGSSPDADTAFRAFYRTKGQTRIRDRVERNEKKFGLQAKAVRIIDLKHRWASCSSDGTLNFHWKCMMAPLTVLDYIVVHELAHLRYPNHTQTFWNAVDKVLPDYRERKSWLRVHGAGMDL